MLTWSADQYTRFEVQRTRPARDLLAAVPLDRVAKAVDLGCGPGNSSEIIAARYPDASLSGIDSSPDMVARARARLPGVIFAEADICAWSPEPDTDLVFSNAVFHWLPDHVDQMHRILNGLRPGGVLAIQIPDNLGEPSHLAMSETANEPRFAAANAGSGTRETILSPRDYVTALTDIAHVDVWRTAYHHRLENLDGVVEWLKGSGLCPYLDRLALDEGDAFLAAYRDRIAPHYPSLLDGSVILPFPRLFIVAQRI